MTVPDYGIPVSAPFVNASYVSLQDAETYFSGRLNSEVWDAATDDDKEKSLITSTRKINQLNFEGLKTLDSQELEFPRNGQSAIPQDIRIATCEIALTLLDGVDLEQEINALAMNGQNYDVVRETYDRSMYVEHYRAGIPSAVAWTYLKPYLRDAAQINLSRV